MRLALAILLIAATPLKAADVMPLRLSEAAEAIGHVVLSADAVPLGRLVATQGSEGAFFSIVRLDAALSAPDTSPMIVQGLLRAADGSLRLPEKAATLADRMGLSLPEG